jgi:hypothetical protein
VPVRAFEPPRSIRSSRGRHSGPRPRQVVSTADQPAGPVGRPVEMPDRLSQPLRCGWVGHRLGSEGRSSMVLAQIPTL